MKSIQINLLNLLILFGISSALPSRIKNLNWFTNYIVDASDDVEYNSTIQTNGTLKPPPRGASAAIVESVTITTSATTNTINNDPDANTTPSSVQLFNSNNNHNNQSAPLIQTYEVPLNLSSESIVRVGIQSPSSSSPSQSDHKVDHSDQQQQQQSDVSEDGSSVGQQAKARRQLNDEPQRRQDIFGQTAQQQQQMAADGTTIATTSTSTGSVVAPPQTGSAGGSVNGLSNHRSHYGDASNHQNYPVEPYPSASYTHLSVRAPSTGTGSTTGGGGAGTSAQASTVTSQTLNALLNRDHHHAFNLTSDHHQGPAGHNSQRSQHLMTSTSQSGPMLHTRDNDSNQIDRLTNIYYGVTNHRGSGGPSQTMTSVKNRPLNPNEDGAQSAYTRLLLHNYGLPSTSIGNNMQLATSGSELNLGTAATLDTGLIQNLTAGLFPISELSNETLQSLSELLIRTKHQANSNHQSITQTTSPLQQMFASASTTSNSSSGGLFSNGYKPSPSFAGHAPLASSQFAAQLSQPHYQGASNYLEALLGDQRFGQMLEYLTAASSSGGQGSPPSSSSPPLSQFGFREPSSTARFRSLPATTYNRVAASSTLTPNTRHNYNPLLQFQQASKSGSAASKLHHEHHGHHQPTTSKQNSNIYNTYLPYKDAQASNGNKPPVTNGQMLKMAATLYDNYLDQNYRNQQPAAVAAASQTATSDQSSSLNQQYQFLQHHQTANNQNQLDKVVYHSTPFRPSIVSPPSVQMGSNGQNGGSGQRPRTEADVKSVTHTPLGHNNGPDRGTTYRQQNQKATSNGAKSESSGSISGGTTTNQNANNNNLIKHDDNESSLDQFGNQNNVHYQSSNQRPRPAGKANTNSTINKPPPTSTDVNVGQQQAATTSSQQQQSSTQQFASKQQPPSQQQQRPVGASSGESFSGQQLLMDLYENTIDSEIKEAIYSGHQQHLHHLEPLIGQSSSGLGGHQQQQAAASSNINWPYDDGALASYEPILPPPTSSSSGALLSSGSGTRPLATTASAYSGQVALGHTPTLHHDYNHLNALTASSGSAGHTHSLDPLATALQELPTFSASDLQPMMPTGGGAGGSSSELAYSTLMSQAAANAFGSQSLEAAQQASITNGEHSTSGDSTNLAALASQLFSQLVMADSQQQQPTGQSNNQHSHIYAPASTTAQTSLMNQLLGLDTVTSTTNGEKDISATLSSGRPNQQQSTTTATGNDIWASQFGASSPIQSLQQAPLIGNGNNNKPSAGLPAILTKLHSSQLSSILTGPFASLYANLPLRHKHTKATKHNHHQHSNNNNQYQLHREPSQVQSTSVAPMATVFGKQRAAWAAAHKAANLLASSSTLTPLQVAILQAQLVSSGFMQPSGGAGTTDSLLAEHSMSQLMPPQAPNDGPNQQHSQQASPFGITSGLAGGGISPLVWRNILSPMIWARKQTLSNIGQSNIGGSNSNNNISNSLKMLQNSTGSHAASLLHHQRRPFMLASSQATHRSPTLASLALMGPLWGSNSANNLGNASSGQYQQQQQWTTAPTVNSFSQLLSLPTSNSSPTANGSPLSLASLMAGSYEQPQYEGARDQQQQPRSRLKIKIVKIPVAFYDVGSSAATGASSDGSQLAAADSMGLSLLSSSPTNAATMLPFHLQPAQTSSLLAGFACNHNHNHNFNNNLGALPFALPSDVVNGQLAGNSAMSFVAQPSAHTSLQQLYLKPTANQNHNGHNHNPSNQQQQSYQSSSLQQSSHPVPSSSSTPAPPPSEQSNHRTLRDFTHINQANDLQVSPTTNNPNQQNIQQMLQPTFTMKFN